MFTARPTWPLFVCSPLASVLVCPPTHYTISFYPLNWTRSTFNIHTKYIRQALLPSIYHDSVVYFGQYLGAIDGWRAALHHCLDWWSQYPVYTQNSACRVSLLVLCTWPLMLIALLLFSPWCRSCFKRGLSHSVSRQLSCRRCLQLRSS